MTSEIVKSPHRVNDDYRLRRANLVGNSEFPARVNDQKVHSIRRGLYLLVTQSRNIQVGEECLVQFYYGKILLSQTWRSSRKSILPPLNSRFL